MYETQSNIREQLSTTTPDVSDFSKPIDTRTQTRRDRETKLGLGITHAIHDVDDDVNASREPGETKPTRFI